MTMSERPQNLSNTRPVAEWAEPEHVRYSDLVPLRSYRGRRSFATLPDGREVEVGAELTPWEAYNKPTADEVRIDRVVSRPHPTSPRQRPPIRELQVIRGWIRPTGTFAGLQAAEDAAAARSAERAARASALHRVDVAETLPPLDRTPEQAIVLGASPDGPSADVLRDVMSKAPKLITTGGHPPVRGVPAIIAWAEGQGVRLGVSGGFLDVRAKRA